MIRVLLAFLWLRRRLLLNSLERTGSRDTLERLSRALERLTPLVMGLMFVPGAVALAGLGAWAGWSIGRDPQALSFTPFTVVRVTLGVVTVAALMTPFIVSASVESPVTVRVLLLPIPRPVLYLAGLASGLADPWNWVYAPMLLAVPAGLAVAGQWGAAALALGAGLSLALCLLSLGALLSFVSTLVLRNRRRGELVMLALMLALTMSGFLPMAFGQRYEARRLARERGRPATARTERIATPALPAWARAAPSEVYASTVGSAARARWISSAGSLAVLILAVAAIQALAWPAYRRLVETPPGTGARRAREPAAIWTRRLPGLSPRASAVAFVQLRLIMRTVRGKMIVLGPAVATWILAVMAPRIPGLAEDLRFDQWAGLPLAGFAALIAFLSLHPFLANQFAVDGPGLTLQFLSPLADADLVKGKTAAGGIIAGLALALCWTPLLLLSPLRLAGVWAAVVLGVVSSYVIAAPVCALVSVLFPRATSLSSLGARGNPHVAASLLAFAATLLAALPPVGLILLATLLLERPNASVLLLAAWTAVSAWLGLVLLRLPIAALARRRENLSLVAEGR